MPASRRNLWLVLGIVLAIVVGAAGATACGPVQYITQVSQEATGNLAAAKAANADKYAPYEYTSAVEYLHKAREEEGYADHAAAVHFGRIASDMASKAREIALAAAASGAPVPTATPAPNTPAGDTENENPLQPAGNHK